MKKFLLVVLPLVVVVAATIGACGRRATGGGQAQLLDLAQSRGLSPEDAAHAIKTFVAPGGRDEYMLFASGGHSGQVHVLGIPSMRLLKTIAVFTPEPWQGYGYGADWSEMSLAGTGSGNDHPTHTNGNGNGGGIADPNGNGPKEPLRWGDAHHPALSETAGKYDGRWLYINDRAHGRIGMVDLSDFRAKQILQVPNLQTSHGGIFATPETQYVHISSKVPALKAWNASKGQIATLDDHLNRYADIYRGYSTFVSVNPQTGRMDLSRSFQIELPPYTQDLADAGKGASDGYAFINSYNVEMATGGIQQGKPPIEVGASKLDFDYLHIINWKKAEQVVAAGKYTELNGIRVISLETAVTEGLLHLAPEPRSPHGVDIAPKGDYITVSGKLDPHATVYGFDLIRKAIESKNYEGTDRYGVPILKFDAVVAGKVELGAGPLHTQYDHQGNAYTSLYLESAVAKWTLGEPYHPADRAFKLVDKVSIHYNIGHLATAQGDTMDPQGKYLVAMNKWSIDRHTNVGPLHPQNFQLIDISGAKMELLADMPIGFGEPHYAQMVKADIIKAHEVYSAGMSPASNRKSPNALASEKDARIERRPGVVEVWMNVVRSHFTPDIVTAKVGDRIIVHLTNSEQTPDATHGFAMPTKNVMVSLDPGETTTVEFVVDKPGTYSYYCTEFCSALHLEMQGWLIVER
ncbi:MAG TPA: Sec-dependent nitrous-oxide reductase [Vicinamibacterales bacterium]|nr:Sec-dependent nitrous-oxide reductase [Vicinamibacterales bacterium]